MDIHICVTTCTLRETRTAVCLKWAVASDSRYPSQVFNIKQMNGPREINLEGQRGENVIEIVKDRVRENPIGRQRQREGRKKEWEIHTGGFICRKLQHHVSCSSIWQEAFLSLYRDWDCISARNRNLRKFAVYCRVQKFAPPHCFCMSYNWSKNIIHNKFKVSQSGQTSMTKIPKYTAQMNRKISWKGIKISFVILSVSRPDVKKVAYDIITDTLRMMSKDWPSNVKELIFELIFQELGKNNYTQMIQWLHRVYTKRPRGSYKDKRWAYM